jgi:hypothetical protein
VNEILANIDLELAKRVAQNLGCRRRRPERSLCRKTSERRRP